MHSKGNRDKKAPEDITNLDEYSGALKDDPLLDKLEAESKRIRELARSRI
jgi:hypothetical protein